MAHLIPILGRFESVSAFTTETYKIHVVEDTLATSIRLANGGIGVATFTFVRLNVYFLIRLIYSIQIYITILIGFENDLFYFYFLKNSVLQVLSNLD